MMLLMLLLLLLMLPVDCDSVDLFETLVGVVGLAGLGWMGSVVGTGAGRGAFVGEMTAGVGAIGNRVVGWVLAAVRGLGAVRALVLKVVARGTTPWVLVTTLTGAGLLTLATLPVTTADTGVVVATGWKVLAHAE